MTAGLGGKGLAFVYVFRGRIWGGGLTERSQLWES